METTMMGCIRTRTSKSLGKMTDDITLEALQKLQGLRRRVKSAGVHAEASYK